MHKGSQENTQGHMHRQRYYVIHTHIQNTYKLSLSLSLTHTHAKQALSHIDLYMSMLSHTHTHVQACKLTETWAPTYCIFTVTYILYTVKFKLMSTETDTRTHKQGDKLTCSTNAQDVYMHTGISYTTQYLL